MQNPLESYRRTQRELRRNFEAFTHANCPTCPTPCCRRPARIAPTDILLAEATGWKARILPVIAGEAEGTETAPDMVVEIAGRMAHALHDAPPSAEAEPDALPCEYLGAQGCTFPTDLRPFGCTTYICKYMYARMDRPSLKRIKRLVRELEDKHAVLMRNVRQMSPENDKDE
jgi:hypothetical protein